MIWKSDPHYQHHNVAERRYHKIRRLTNTIFGRTGAPAYTCLLALIYVCLLLNNTYIYGINGIPITKYTGSNSYIIPLFRFRFGVTVHYKVDDSDFHIVLKNVVDGLVLTKMLDII